MRWTIAWLAFAVFASSMSAAPQDARRPNILFLMADEFRHDCLGVAGHPLVRTPTLDRLAREGLRFTRAYVASPVCSPSRGSSLCSSPPSAYGISLSTAGKGLASWLKPRNAAAANAIIAATR